MRSKNKNRSGSADAVRLLATRESRGSGLFGRNLRVAFLFALDARAEEFFEKVDRQRCYR
jgi:hypothetical protein